MNLSTLAIVLGLVMSPVAFAKGHDANCQVTKNGKTKTVHAKNETTCAKRGGTWVTSTTHKKDQTKSNTEQKSTEGTTSSPSAPSTTAPSTTQPNGQKP